MRFENKVAIVTGGSSGIGKEVAKRFLSEGGSVVINGRDARKRTLPIIRPHRAASFSATSSGTLPAPKANITLRVRYVPNCDID